ncbi:MAG: thiamine pyrophosphate-binding protein [Thaumarchaeota archaeon]|nr:thiamine pyrophosphate-binding protein [Nitrososphaerota archaeon]
MPKPTTGTSDESSAKSTRKPEYVSDMLVDLMKAYDVEYVALNPGATVRALHDSIVNYGGNERPEMILCCHEHIALCMAQGYARVTGKPMVTMVHNVAGLLNAMNAIFHGYCSKVPLMILGGTGPMDVSKRRPWIDWIHTALVQGNVVRDIVKWDDQPEGALSAAESFIRGYRVATTEPNGPVYLCFDVELQESSLPSDFNMPDVKNYPGHTPISGDIESLRKVAQRLVESENPVILTDLLGRNPSCVDRLVQLAEMLAIPVVDLGSRFNFPNTHPLDLTGARTEVLKNADLVLALDVEDLYGDLTMSEDDFSHKMSYVISDKTRVIQIGLLDLWIRSWSENYQRLQSVDISIPADTSAALPYLVEFCRDAIRHGKRESEVFGERSQKWKERHDALRTKWQDDAKKTWDQKPISTARLAAEVWDVIKDEDWVLANGTLSGWARKLWTWSQPYQYVGKSGAGSAGYGFSSALGAALAYKHSRKLCVDLQPDGDLLYFSSALWTAASSKIPMMVVMFNNRSYYNDEEHQEHLAVVRKRPVENKGIGIRIDNPPPNFAKLAQSFGLHGEGPIEDPSEVKEALMDAKRIVKEKRSLALVDIVVQPR